ncbi:MAG: precorrin-8X methylmutase [Hyphomicrobiales bacterium]
MTMSYLKDPASIYEASFAAIRAEADLSRFEGDMEALAMRLIHACGMIDIAAGLRFSPSVVSTASAALNSGATVITDCEMVAAAIIRRMLPRSNEVICTLNDPQTPALAAKHETTRSAAAVSLWEPHVEGAVVAIGNAPTTLFALLEALDAGMAKPAAILGFPVGFVGALESKQALAENPRGVDFVTLAGRRGGSAMAGAAVNAIAAGLRS